MRFRSTSTVVITVLTLLLIEMAHPCLALDYKVRIRTPLGVDTEKETLGIYYLDPVVKNFAESPEGCTPSPLLMLQCSSNVWAAFQLAVVRDVIREGETCTVTTTNGVVLQGKLFAGGMCVKGTDGMYEDNRYDLSSIKTLTVVARPQYDSWGSYFQTGGPTWGRTPTGPLWTLSGTEMKGNFTVRSPRFAVRYPVTTTGYVPVGHDRAIAKTTTYFKVDVTPFFRVQIDTQNVQGEAVDFKRIDITRKPQPMIGLLTGDGTRSSGTLTMVKEKPAEWAVVCELAASPGVVLLLFNPECALTRARGDGGR